ncbi:MAG TPA: pilus assembly protein PilP [Desulfobacterales bacterium]|nr:pilus assembly protein PilP [Desulfobacterales bacterium]
MDRKQLQANLDNFIDTKVATLDNNRKLLIAAAVLLLPVVAFYFLYYSPKADDIGRLESSLRQLQNELTVIKAKASHLDEQKALQKAIEIKFKEASRVIPDTKEIPSLLTNISSLGTGAGLDILSFKPGGESPHDFYAEIPVSISVTGTYHNIGHFLDTVSKLPRIVNVNEIKLSSPTMQGGEMVLKSSINLVTYKFIEPKPKDKKKRGH